MIGVIDIVASAFAIAYWLFGGWGVFFALAALITLAAITEDG